MSGASPVTERARRAIYADAEAIIRAGYARDLRPDAVARRGAGRPGHPSPHDLGFQYWIA